jgi:hypothetical protein
VVTDIGFLVYWIVTALGALPTAWLFKDYQNPILVSWNWSFAPIDLLASFLGLVALVVAKQGAKAWRQLALMSVTLTFCAGFMALAFWVLRQDFDPWWWLPNLYLALWPLFLVRQLICAETPNISINPDAAR